MHLTDTQHRILLALCRPAAGGNGFAPPATNREIADEVFLSVDAVKAHLRTLYRKFEIEDLPHNQKRARLVELVIEGGYLGEPGPAEGPAAPQARPAPTTSPGRDRRWRWLLGAAIAGICVVALAALALAGVFSNDNSQDSTFVASYRQDVAGYCRLGLATGAGSPGATQRARARSYLAVIETVRGRVDSLAPPTGRNHALERFLDGLRTAADNTSIVAEDPPPSGSRTQADVVAELTFAAGQVQAGALGYRLGPACVAIGDLVARSARNAAHSS
jgi:hypothetical protein